MRFIYYIFVKTQQQSLQLLKLGTVNTQVQFGIKMWFSNGDDTLNF